MKKTNKIVVLICILGVLAMALTGCEIGRSNVERKEINKKELGAYTEYVHSSGVKFSYPSEWKNLTTTDDQPVFGNTSTGISANYLSESVSKVLSIDVYMTTAIKNIKEQKEIVSDIEEQKVVLNGIDASIIKYTINQYGTNLVVKQACFIDNGTASILTTACLESNYEEFAEILDNIISSFSK